MINIRIHQPSSNLQTQQAIFGEIIHKTYHPFIKIIFTKAYSKHHLFTIHIQNKKHLTVNKSFEIT